MVYWVYTATHGSFAEQIKKGRGRPRGSSIQHKMPVCEGLIQGLGLEQKWIEKLTKYLDFLKRQGREPKMSMQDTDEFRLAQWYGRQCMLYKKGELSKERTVLLEKTMELNRDKEREWLMKLSNYLEFKKKYGREPKFTLNDADERMLAEWRNNLNRPNNIGKLSQEKRKLLEENGFSLEPRDRDLEWHSHLADYREFVRNNGRPPSTWTADVEEKRIARWRANQAKNNGRGVPIERRRILEENGILAPRKRGRQMNPSQEADSA
jgi:predicted HicB family RNase H-like nuclease